MQNTIELKQHILESNLSEADKLTLIELLSGNKKDRTNFIVTFFRIAGLGSDAFKLFGIDWLEHFKHLD